MILQTIFLSLVTAFLIVGIIIGIGFHVAVIMGIVFIGRLEAMAEEKMDEIADKLRKPGRLLARAESDSEV